MKIISMFAEGIGSAITDALPGEVDTTKVMMNIINGILYVVGLLAVVMIVVAGVQMTTSAGDPGVVKKAKVTITYAIVGLVVAILAYAIVNFVISRL